MRVLLTFSRDAGKSWFKTGVLLITNNSLCKICSLKILQIKKAVLSSSNIGATILDYGMNGSEKNRPVLVKKFFLNLLTNFSRNPRKRLGARMNTVGSQKVT